MGTVVVNSCCLFSSAVGDMPLGGFLVIYRKMCKLPCSFSNHVYKAQILIFFFFFERAQILININSSFRESYFFGQSASPFFSLRTR